MVQVKVAVPVAPVPSVTVTVTVDVARRGGRAGDQPGGGVDRQPRGQAGGGVGQGLPDAESVAWTCTLAAVPTVPVWLPGLVTVTVSCRCYRRRRRRACSAPR